MLKNTFNVPTLVSQTAMELVASHTRDMFVVTDATGHAVWVNDAFERGTGYTREEVIGRRPGDLLQGPETSAEDREVMRAAIRERRVIRTEILNYTKAGEPYWIDIELSPVLGENDDLLGFVAVERDITERRHLEQVDRAFTAVQRALNEQAIVSMADRTGRITFVNDQFCNVSGYDREALLGQDHRMVSSGFHDKAFFAELWRQILTGDTWHGEICNRAKTGALYWVDTTIVPVPGADGNPEGFISIRYDITDKKRAEGELKSRATRDELTGLFNRREFMRRLTQVTGGSDRQSDSAGGVVVLFDMDRFKDINDRWGHHVGDEVLKQVSSRLTDSVRIDDVVCRLGGDEFAMLLKLDESRSINLLQLLQRVKEQISHPIALEETKILPSFSMGVTCYPSDSTEPIDLLKNADIAMYEAKTRGRDTICFFNQELQQRVNQKLAMRDALRKAIAEDQFFVMLQPQMDLTTGGLRGFEALARWVDQGKPVPPPVFLDVAEEFGDTVALGRLLLRKAMAAFRRLLDLDLAVGILGINISPTQLQTAGFSDDFTLALEEYALRPSRVEIEITETALICDSNREVEQNLKALSDLGVSVALDDFGTGYSSLVLLKRFQVDILKVDRTFVGGLTESPDDQQIVRVIIELARSLGMQVVGEGAETAEEAELLRSFGCHFAQGYYHAKPLVCDDAARFAESVSQRLETCPECAHTG